MSEMRVVGVRVELPANQPILLLRETSGDRWTGGAKERRRQSRRRRRERRQPPHGRPGESSGEEVLASKKRRCRGGGRFLAWGDVAQGTPQRDLRNGATEAPRHREQPVRGELFARRSNSLGQVGEMISPRVPQGSASPVQPVLPRSSDSPSAPWLL